LKPFEPGSVVVYIEGNAVLAVLVREQITLLVADDEAAADVGILRTF